MSNFARRDILRWGALGGLALMAPRRARAGTSTYQGPFWITVHAAGGWDPTLFCDPKGGVAGKKDSVNQSYTPDQIVRVGTMPVAPTTWKLDAGGGNQAEIFSPVRFFTAHAGRFVVVNGLDTATNNHETGARTVMAGRSLEGFPNVAALAAGIAFEAAPAPMAYLSYGGYDGTGGGVPLTRASNVDHLWRVAFPNRIDPKKADSNTFLSPDTFARVQAAQAARAGRLLASDPMPVARRSISTLFASRSGETGLADIATYLPAKAASIDELPDLAALPSGSRGGRLGDIENFMRQSQLAIAAFQAGVGVGASLVMGGFDTHSDHDNNHTIQLVKLLRGVDDLIARATAAGIIDKLYIVIGSDFGRTPFYNAGNGKDHWATTSMLVAGPGITGGRVIGSSDAGFRPESFDKATLRPDLNGSRLKPEHVHAALRKGAKLDSARLARAWPVTSEVLPFFV